MATDLTPLALEEYRALRATIRERGTMRLLVAMITFVAWAAGALAVVSWASVSALALLPLLVLVAGFEVVFAAHVGVERIGRYLQTYYETPGPNPPQWERLAMEIGPQAGAGSGIDPLFTAVFVLAGLLNLVPTSLLSLSDGPTLPGGVPLELAVYGMLHALFIGRLFRARRFAARQRARELQLFKAPGARP
ncbi:MAG TPA: hypothetical protein VLT86_05760 [Vicinamibacterales bacterium]|nr:hypothetical protein [Vicinamibacterales bacterium]